MQVSQLCIATKAIPQAVSRQMPRRDCSEPLSMFHSQALAGADLLYQLPRGPHVLVEPPPRTCYDRHLDEMARYPRGSGIELPFMPPVPVKGEPAWKREPKGAWRKGELMKGEPKGSGTWMTGEPKRQRACLLLLPDTD